MITTLHVCPCVDLKNLIYQLPIDGHVTHVFDGHVALDGICAPKIDEIGGRIQLMAQPAFEVRAVIVLRRPA